MEEKSAEIASPAISLPKGGGAIRGIGEKFGANPVTGTGSMSIPIATSPGRSNFGPQLSLSYNSGSGNGPFGFGWSLSTPAITRKTDKGLPQYNDAEESDVFILSGAEDLVSVLNSDGSRFEDNSSVPNYTIHRYRPRIEGLFARIERWTRQSDGEVHWRSISKDNILTLYGKDVDSRIADPEDSGRIFSWLTCETRDDKGNAVLYEYNHDDGTGVDLTLANERNRGSKDDKKRTINRYIKHIYYGNRSPLLNNVGKRLYFLTDIERQNAGWMFQVVFDYGEHNIDVPKPDDLGEWDYRNDPFSTYRSGFEVRTTRLCQRVLMFHHFKDEIGVGNDCLVRSTDFTYSHEEDPTSVRNPVYTFLSAVTQTGYKRKNNGYQKSSLPPVEFEYTKPDVQNTVEEVDPESLDNLPIGVDGANYQWTDLHGEGIPGILTEQANAWFYKRNLSPIRKGAVAFAPIERVAVKPNTSLTAGAQLMDLAGDGQLDLVMLDGPTPGLFEHDNHEGWQSFRSFTSPLARNLRDPNLKFVDLDGDGHADVFITEDEAFIWHTSLAEEGFGPARRVAQVLDEEKGPRLVFSDGTESIYLTDLSGDGLTDLARVRNNEICYWPNLGYGRFGAKITMDHPPHFDNPDQFDHKRIRLADIDGTGTTDIIYLHREGVRLYFNQSGNSWSERQILSVFPRVDDLVAINTIDLLGNGTACLVWSSPLPGDATRPMRYVNLMGGQKPHLLVKSVNNLGAETLVKYASSAQFYLQDKYDGKPWITRLPFPVHVVERVETFDHISKNRFATRYAYHHGYFDGEEREFRGFGMVEQWDTEELAALTADGALPDATNIDVASHVPPVHTKTWFHTGAYLNRNHISNFFAGFLDPHDTGEYYREPGLTDAQARILLLADTILPADLNLDEEREACRALKGSMLRQEVYALDGSDKAEHPYTVVEQNFTIRRLQVRNDNRQAVFFTHPREVVTYNYERNPHDPRIQHALVLQVDDYGNVQKEISIGYGRRQPDANLPLKTDRDKQTQRLITYAENHVTNTIDDVATYPHDYRAPMPCEVRTFELTGFVPEGNAARFTFDEWTRNDFALLKSAAEIAYEQGASKTSKEKRPIEHVRTLYRHDDLTTLLPLCEVMPLALPGESYKLAFTPDLAKQIYVDSGKLTLNALNNILANEGKYVHSEGDANWWIPSGWMFYSPGNTDAPAQELAYARQHFFLPQRYRNPFYSDTVSTETFVTYDAYDLMMVETRDPLDNRVTVGERDTAGNLTMQGNDYRVLQPRLVMDPNRNRTAVAFDTLGMVVGTAVMGKPEENLGDTLAGFDVDLDETVTLEHLAAPYNDPHDILRHATTRLVYDLFAYRRTKNQPNPQPAVVYTLARETHAADLAPSEKTRIQHSFSYSDGFGREIQKKIQAEPEKNNGIIGPPRWVGSGWTIFNNKGKPVRQYEPFFTSTHRFEFGVQVGVSPILLYDPVGRVVAPLHPNHSYEKVVFDPWRQTTYDVNDTTTFDPRVDADVKGFILNPDGTLRIPEKEYQPTWHALRTDPLHATELETFYPNPTDRIHQREAATKAAAHTDTPTTAYFDTLGRPFLTVAHNKVICPNHDLDGTEDKFHTRVELDIEGNQRTVRDASTKALDSQGNDVADELGRIVMRYEYDMLGNRIHQLSMEAGARWMLNDVAGNPIRAWDDREHQFRTEYDPLRRPLRSFVTGANPSNTNQELLTERLVYGEQHPEAEQKNLRGSLHIHLDQAGAIATETNDFKGNALRATRRIAIEYKRVIDWSTVDTVLPTNATARFDQNTMGAALTPTIEDDVYVTTTTHDAFNRPVVLTTPHTPNMQSSIIRPGYNEANLLERMDANLHGEQQDGQPVWTPFVTNIDYDAKGQRERIDYGNGVSTNYGYDPLTFRLEHLLTKRDTVLFSSDCPQPRKTGWPGCQVQNLHHTYDPMGNITHIRDDSQQTIFFKNKRVEPSAEYTYDAIYRLIEATGREHLGQNGLPVPHSHDDSQRIQRPLPTDGNAMSRYCEKYVYDAVGNFISMSHHNTCTDDHSWKRGYLYNEATLIEQNKDSNRLSSTKMGSHTPEGYAYDIHGNMTRMDHLPLMQWDYRDQLQATARQVVNNGGRPETTYYVYDSTGQRVRKVTENQSPAGEIPKRKEERFYFGGFEIYRTYASDGKTVKLERETLHIMDNQQRIALVETRTLDLSGNDPAPRQLIQYQLVNHLGSGSLVLDDQAQIISYEEYTPFGNSSYQAIRGQKEGFKRYRYAGKERDEECGFYYHGARYYAPWLGKWTSTDPSGPSDSLNLFQYVGNNPIRFVDPNGAATVDTVVNFAKNYAQLHVDIYTDVASIPVNLVKERVEDLGNAVESAKKGEAVEAAGWYLGVNRPVKKIAEKYTEYTDAGASSGEAAGLIVGDETGINNLAEATTGEDLYGNPLSTEERLVKGATGASQFAGVVITVAGGVTKVTQVPNNTKTRGVLGTNSGSGYADEVLPGGNSRAIAGHGEYRLGSGAGDAVVPQGTVLVAPRQNIRISENTGQVLESIDLDKFVSVGPKGKNLLIRQRLDDMGVTDIRERNRVFQDLKGAKVLQPGDTLPNYTIKTPDGLKIYESSTTVNQSTPLSDILKPDSGVCSLATCTEFKIRG